MAEDDCDCAGPNIPARRPRPRMGVSSLNRAPMQSGRSLSPRSTSPPRFPRTVPGLSRSSGLDTTLCPGSPDAADKTVTRPPDFTKFEETMEQLTKLDFVEQIKVEEALGDFQKKRRKLVFDMVSLKMSKAKKSVQKAVSRMGL